MGRHKKLSEADIENVLLRIARGDRHVDIAADYRVNPSTIGAIKARHADHRAAHDASVEPPRCNMCAGTLDRDGVCGDCGAEGLDAWTPPPGYEKPVTDQEIRARQSRVARASYRIPDEQVYELRRKFRASELTMHKFLKEQKVSKEHGAAALRGTNQYRDL